MHRRLAFLLLLAAVLTLWFGGSPSLAAAEESREIVATGLGGGKDPGKARDDAIDDALRKAVEQGVGAYVSSESLVDKMVLVEDRIYSESRGFIESYKILKEKREDGIFEVTISAVVKMANLAKELEAIGLIIRQKENPRVMVVVHSRETGSAYRGVEQEGNSSSENQLEKILLAKGFRLVDAGQTRRRQELESFLLAGDPSQAGRLAKDFGAEILIEAEVRRAFVDERQVLGRSMRFFTNEISLKAIETDTARILYSGYDSRPASGAAALTPLEESTGKLARQMVASILEQWSKDVYDSATYTLNVDRINFSQLNQLISGLKELRGVGQVRTRSFQAGAAALEVGFQGSATDLAGRLADLDEPRVEVTGLQANTIELRPKGKQQ